MKLTARLALAQVKAQKNRSLMTILGIGLSSAMLTAVCGFVASAKDAMDAALGTGGNYGVVRMAALGIVGAIFASIIIACAAIVISNSFRVSAGERMRQFGMLKSAGATKKQIAASVMYEGLFLSSLGIPPGIAAGLLAELAGISVANNAFHSLYEGGVFVIDIVFPFSAAAPTFILSIAVSFGTVMLSAWLPARRAAAIAAIDAIRTSDIAMGRRFFPGRAAGGHTAMGAAPPRLMERVFGFEGALAAKFIKRSRRSFRAAVVSLTISIVLIVAAGSFGSMMGELTALMRDDAGAAVSVRYLRSIKVNGENGETIQSLPALPYALAESISEKLREYPDTAIYGGGRVGEGVLPIDESMATDAYKDYLRRQWQGAIEWPDRLDVNISTLDARQYEQICGIAGVPLGSRIFVNYLRLRTDTGYAAAFAPLDAPLGTMALLDHNGEPYSLKIDAAISGSDVPAWLPRVAGYCSVIVPETTADAFTWLADTPDHAGFAAYAEQVMGRLEPGGEMYYGFYTVTDWTAQIAQQNTIFDTIMFFVGGFVGMLALIAVTSVISTVSTNIRSRSREFAVLQSVGMTREGIRRMLNLESAMSSARSLLFGLPIGLTSAYGMYRALDMMGAIAFSVPWAAIACCVLCVFMITWLTMRHTAGRLKGMGAQDG
ncbi:MAG: ABC transporter permease [Clostridiales Family XIII bacterium]|jgi:putative ABC transport system permease protein|nr:ABC transporter permease [Clostridiales Family XIII bacterium]